MTDREFLKWIHARLAEVHGEKETYDYMHKLRAIILDTPPDKVTPNANSYNSLKELNTQENDK